MSDNIEQMLKEFSVVSDREDGWLPEVILKKDESTIFLDPAKMSQLLERFSNEKPFGILSRDMMARTNISRDELVKKTGISPAVLDKVLSNKALPNSIPLKRMRSLLNLLQISMKQAIESFRASLHRYVADPSLESNLNPAMRRKRDYFLNIANAEKSVESAKKDLEIYIQRLLKEGG